MLFDEKQFQDDLSSSVDALKKRFASIRSGRALPALLEPIMVEAYGGTSPLSSVATVASVDARMLSVQVWDAQVAPSVVKAIRNKGFQVQEQSTNVRVIIPEMSEEQRKKMVKMVRDYAEEVRIALRNTRRRFIDAMDKEKNTVSEDDMYAAKKDVQTIMDKAIKNVDALLEAKEKEILA